MCTVCGCSGASHEHEHGPDCGHDHHGHEHHGHPHHHAHPPLGSVHAPGMSPSRIIQVERDILSHNNAFADRNREQLGQRGVFALNLVSSPGSGKTTLLCRTIEMLKNEMPVAVIEGDQQTSFDADRIRATGAPAVQINTGKGCHLDAHMVMGAIDTLAPAQGSVLFIENVGNLVCPAAFDLGEDARVVVLSVTEGEDKPLKYPDIFANADIMILNKVDLLPHLDFDVEACVKNARRVNPNIGVLQVSARTGAGFEDWLAWLKEGRRHAVAAQISRLEQVLAAAREMAAP